jgi:hypothetical protein
MIAWNASLPEKRMSVALGFVKSEGVGREAYTRRLIFY